MIYPSEEEFLKLTKKGTVIPIYKDILGDLETPVSAYYRLANESPYSFLLESVEGEEKIARYSFISRDPELIFEAKGANASITYVENNKMVMDNIPVDGSPLPILREIMKKFKFVKVPGLPPFCGGMVGYMSYNMIHYFEKLPRQNKDDLNLPDMLLMLARDMVIFEHRTHRIKVVHCAFVS